MMRAVTIMIANVVFLIGTVSCDLKSKPENPEAVNEKQVSPQEELVAGTWKWAAIIDSAGKVHSIEDFTKGESKGLVVELRRDHTYVEKDFNENSKPTHGQWKLEENGSVLSTAADTQSGNWKSKKILKVMADSLVLKMSDQYRLVLIKTMK
jgi:hypothetical protein